MPEGRHFMYDWGRYRTLVPQAYVGSGAECREGVGGWGCKAVFDCILLPSHCVEGALCRVTV